MRVDTDRAFILWTNTILPVVLIGKTASRPTNDGYVQVLQRTKHIVTETASVRDVGILTNPDSAINATPEVLGKLTVEIAADGIAGLVGLNSQLNAFGVSLSKVCAANDQDHHSDQSKFLHACLPLFCVPFP
jgi:hypothetical protein